MNETFSTLVVTGGRIKEERLRLELSQAEAAAQCACVRETWGKYERGVFDMNTETLRAFAALGADMLYILTGSRSQPMESRLSPRAQAMLANYEAADDEGKKHIESTASLLSERACFAKKA